MFEALKKNKTLRSILAAAAVFSAGTPAVAQQNSITGGGVAQNAETIRDIQIARADLAKNYLPLCAQLEQNLCYCYDDDGVPAVGVGVRLKYHPNSLKTQGIKVTFKKGTVVDLTKKIRLTRLANADWKQKKTFASFPEVEKVEVIQLGDYKGKLPAGTDTKWNGSEMVLVPTWKLKTINESAMNDDARLAYKFHPNLFTLSPLAQEVIMDLVHHLGEKRYPQEFTEFFKAVAVGDLDGMYQQCTTKNTALRNATRKALLKTAILMRDNPTLPEDRCLGLLHSYARYEHPKLTKRFEPGKLSELEVVVKRVCERRVFPVHVVRRTPEGVGK